MTGSFKNFAGTSPGQNLGELVGRISQDALGVVLGDDVLELIASLQSPSSKSATARKCAAKVIGDPAYRKLERPEIRAICFDALSDEKLSELAERVGVSGIEELRRLDPCGDKETWRLFLGFFGVDAQRSVPFAPLPDHESVRPEYGLFPHQRKASDSVANAIRGGHGRVILHMPTGSGKTRTAMHVISRFLAAEEPCVVAWLANSAELLEQAADAFQRAWARLGNREVDLLRFWGNHAPVISAMTDGVLVAGLQKMHAYKQRDPLAFLRLSKCVKLVVIDEAHQAIAPTYRTVIETLSETGAQNAIVGLTATPGRTWSDIAVDQALSEFFGGRKATLEVDGWDDPVSYLMAEGYLAKPTFHRLVVECHSEIIPNLVEEASEGGDYHPVLLDSLSERTERNIAIIKEALRLIEAGHKRIILFGSSVRHAEVLATGLFSLGIDGRVVTGETGATTRERAIKAFRKPSPQPMILCNFGVLTTGFDAPNTSAAIIARPTKSLVLFSQMVGRATRGPKAGGNETCEISTVIDIDLPGFGNVADAFTNWEDIWRDRN